jgi:hypothetical protein
MSAPSPSARPPSEITLERAITVIAQAETALADIDTARRKGYLAETCSMVFAFMDDWRIVQGHIEIVVHGKPAASITSPSAEQADTETPAEAPQIKTFSCRFAQTMFTIIEVQAPDEDAAYELAADIYENDAPPPDFYGDYEIDEVKEAPHSPRGMP